MTLEYNPKLDTHAHKLIDAYFEPFCEQLLSSQPSSKVCDNTKNNVEYTYWNGPFQCKEYTRMSHERVELSSVLRLSHLGNHTWSSEA